MTSPSPVVIIGGGVAGCAAAVASAEAGGELQFALDIEQHAHQAMTVEAEPIERFSALCAQAIRRHFKLARQGGVDGVSNAISHGRSGGRDASPLAGSATRPPWH